MPRTDAELWMQQLLAKGERERMKFVQLKARARPFSDVYCSFLFKVQNARDLTPHL